MAFRGIFEELYWGFESIMSAVLCILRNSLFPEEALTEKDLQNNLSENNMNKKLS